MKSLLVGALLLALGWPIAARADARTHRFKLAGIALTAVGATLTAGGVATVTYGVYYPPPLDVHHGPCSSDCDSGLATNWPVIIGATGLVIGAAALATGIALLVVGKRGDRTSVAVTGGGLRVRF